MVLSLQDLGRLQALNHFSIPKLAMGGIILTANMRWLLDWNELLCSFAIQFLFMQVSCFGILGSFSGLPVFFNIMQNWEGLYDVMMDKVDIVWEAVSNLCLFAHAALHSGIQDTHEVQRLHNDTCTYRPQWLWVTQGRIWHSKACCVVSQPVLAP